jgi:hypothetical protein
MEDKELSKLEKLEQNFLTFRKIENKEIQENIIDKLDDVAHIADVQVHVASKRHKFIDKIAEIKHVLAKKKRDINTFRVSKLRDYKTNFDVKLTDYQIKDFIENDLKNDFLLTDLLEIQVEYLSKTIDTLDKVDYKIKYLIEVHKFQNGISF